MVINNLTKIVLARILYPPSAWAFFKLVKIFELRCQLKLSYELLHSSGSGKNIIMAGVIFGTRDTLTRRFSRLIAPHLTKGNVGTHLFVVGHMKARSEL